MSAIEGQNNFEFLTLHVAPSTASSAAHNFIDTMDTSDRRAEFEKKWGIDATEPSDPQEETDNIQNGDEEEYEYEPCILGDSAFSIPLRVLALPNLEDIFTIETWRSLSLEDKQNLMKYLPPAKSDEEIEQLLIKLFNGENFAFGRSPLKEFCKELKGGSFHPEIQKLKSTVASLRKQHAIQDRIEHSTEIAKSIIETKRELGMETQEDEEELLRMFEEQRNNDYAPAVARARSYAKTVIKGHDRVSERRRRRKSKLIPAFLPDEEEREEGYSTESLSDTDIRYLSGQVEEVVDEEPLSWEAPSSKKSKKRKRGKEEELSPQITVTATFAQPTVLDAAAELEDEELNAPKSKRRRDKTRREQRMSHPPPPPIEVFSLFSSIQKSLNAHDDEATLEEIVSDISKNPRLVHVLPPAYTMTQFVDIALHFLSNPISSSEEQPPPMTMYDPHTMTWRWTISRVPTELLEQLEATFFFLISRKQFDPETYEFRTNILRQIKTYMSLEELSPEELEEFHNQERARYQVPDKPFLFVRNGYRSWVAPTKMAAPKGRDHFLLKANRPNYITVLSLVRDAASRLPGGVGTRADVAFLLRESQYINEGFNDQISAVVSGALDRLHSEPDPPVRFDNDQKLWVYTHRQRLDTDYNEEYMNYYYTHRRKADKENKESTTVDS